ncbi:fibro-slime domain-containing protein [Xenococcus sp. PCC 7305]|uniref:fibro-slime domain-containing protein n=1 Tax=Xenococcus sp. PCC 7305 TaxID=102125 RepID=UPI0002ACA777|nr:fibro-slime domain-containing protein [Xenococcus sp. PCC 7305]ELS02544.1 fibro-slime domain-containing protein [Xenococcus sp. PCC 7305]
MFDLSNCPKIKPVTSKLFAISLLGLSAFGLLATKTPANPDSIILTGTIRDFQASHPDFEFFLDDGNNISWNSEFEYDRGIVTDTIGVDKKPVYAHDQGSTPSTSGANNFNQWYNDVPGVNLSKEHSITLTKQADGMYQYSNSSFFPINGELYGNVEDDPNITAPTSGWIYDGWISGKSGNNYYFTYEIHNSFTYQGGETFTFAGDDDVWVYINGKRVIDIGGVHTAQTQTVNLDDIANAIGLVVGETYDFDFFFAERCFQDSRFTITTNIDLVESTEPIPSTANQPPEAVDDSVEDSVRILTLNVLANDNDPDLAYNPDELITISSVHNITGGNAEINSEGMIVYTPTNGIGTYSLDYLITDTAGDTDVGTVTIDLLGID